jgi:hypothetical protein
MARIGKNRERGRGEERITRGETQEMPLPRLFFTPTGFLSFRCLIRSSPIRAIRVIRGQALLLFLFSVPSVASV